MQVLYDALEGFGHHSLGKINEDDLNESLNWMIMVCHSLNNNTRTGLVISLCLNVNTLISDPPGWPQILDIYSAVVL